MLLNTFFGYKYDFLLLWTLSFICVSFIIFVVVCIILALIKTNNQLNKNIQNEEEN